MKFEYLLATSLALFSLTSFSIIGTDYSDYLSRLARKNVLSYRTGIVPSQKVIIPARKENSAFLELSAKSVLVVDLSSDITLYEKNADLPIPPASTTKIVTALVALDTFPKEKMLEVDYGSTAVEGQKMDLTTGENISVENLLYGLLIYSANDAAEVFAKNYQGGRELFIDTMNKKAKETGMLNSYFTNPSGLDGSTHLTTARDLVTVSTYAMKDPVFREIVATREIEVVGTGAKGSEIVHALTNINELVGEVDGVLGIKTGWTYNAQENLVTYLERNGNKIIIAVLGSQDRFGETKSLIDWVLDNYTWQVVEI